jgi:hypothetical protein
LLKGTVAMADRSAPKNHPRINAHAAAAAGEMTARFMPADPAVWFEAASANGYHACILTGPDGSSGISFHLLHVPWETVAFFAGWLNATPGGLDALAKYLKARGIDDIPRGA